MHFDVGTIVTLFLALLSFLIAWLGWSIKTGFTEPLHKLTEQITDLNEFLMEVRDETNQRMHEHEVHLAKHDEQIKTLFERGDG